MIRVAVSSLALILAATTVQAAPPSPAIAAAIADTTRPAADRDRDADRKPAEMLAFAGVKPGMVVVGAKIELPNCSGMTTSMDTPWTACALRSGLRTPAILESFARSSRCVLRSSCSSVRP